MLIITYNWADTVENQVEMFATLSFACWNACCIRTSFTCLLCTHNLNSFTCSLKAFTKSLRCFFFLFVCNNTQLPIEILDGIHVSSFIAQLLKMLTKLMVVQDLQELVMVCTQQSQHNMYGKGGRQSKACANMKWGNKKFREASRVYLIQNWVGTQNLDTKAFNEIPSTRSVQLVALML